MHFNSAGSAAYGSGTIAVDGAIPSALSAVVGGGTTGPYWLTAAKLAYQNFTSGSFFQSYDTGTHALAELSGTGCNTFGAGNGVWAKWLASGIDSGVLSNAAGVGPFPLGGVLDVSRDGEIAIVTNRATQTGLTVYDATGATLVSKPSIAFTSPRVALRNHILAYQDMTGWHLLDVLTGATPFWYPRIDGVAIVVPVMVGTDLFVAEAGATMSLRLAKNSQGFVLETTPVYFNPDAVSVTAGIARVGYCALQGEAASSLLVTDVTVATGANQRGTIVGGAIVYTTGAVLPLTTFTVGPSEGSDLTTKGYPPFQDFLDLAGKTKIEREPWKAYLRNITGDLSTVSAYAQAIPMPAPPPPSFGIVAPPAPAVALVASTPSATIALTSADESVIQTTDPSTLTLDLSSRVSALTIASLRA